MPPRRPAGRAVPQPDPELLVPRALLNREIEERLESGMQLLNQEIRGDESVEQLRREFQNWDDYNEELLKRRFTTPAIAEEYVPGIYGFGGRGSWQQELGFVRGDIARQRRKLESIQARLELIPEAKGISTAPSFPTTSTRGSKVFVVHGHDGEIKLQVADFLEKTTGQRPIILHEQADSGRTIIEKFEDHASEAGFAVVILTADDVGSERGAQTLNPRARQNVVLELGFFIGTLGRGSVVALYENGVERPSDLSGVLYKPLTGNWHTELAKELKVVGIDCDLGKL